MSLRWRGGGGGTGGMLESSAIGRRELERIGQLAHGVGARARLDAAFEVADAAHAQSGALGQFFLGHTEGDAVAAE